MFDWNNIDELRARKQLASDDYAFPEIERKATSYEDFAAYLIREVNNSLQSYFSGLINIPRKSRLTIIHLLSDNEIAFLETFFKDPNQAQFFNQLDTADFELIIIKIEKDMYGLHLVRKSYMPKYLNVTKVDNRTMTAFSTICAFLGLWIIFMANGDKLFGVKVFLAPLTLLAIAVTFVYVRRLIQKVTPLITGVNQLGLLNAIDFEATLSKDYNI